MFSKVNRIKTVEGNRVFLLSLRFLQFFRFKIGYSIQIFFFS